MPTVDIRPAANSQLGEEAHSSAITTLRSVLLDAGFKIIDNGTGSDFSLTLELRSETRRPSGELGNFHTAYVEGGLVLRKTGGDIVHQIVLDRVKGVQLDPSTALNLALSNLAESIREKHANNLIQAFR